MSSSRPSDEFLENLDWGPRWAAAESYVARELHLELGGHEHLGEDWVLTPDDVILAGCQRIIDSSPGSAVLEVLVAALRGSYHLARVHTMLTQIAVPAADKWRNGDRGRGNCDLLRHVSQVYRYGVKPADLDFVLRMCSDPAFGPQDADDGEDLRAYWFVSLAKLKDPRVGAFCRDLIQQDLGSWSDFRLIDLMRVAAKSWESTDAEPFGRIAAEHPDSWIRQNAKRILERHT